jgi:hypothetical protein
MPDPELTDRLRDAFALPREPGAGPDVRESLAGRLPRYRNRRRGALGGSRGGVAAVLAVVLVFALGGFSSGPAKPPALAAAGPQCVELQIGTAPARCAGHISSSAAPSAATDRQSFAPTEAGPRPSAPTIRVPPGLRVTVSLPARSGLTWTSVTLQAPSATGRPGSGAQPVVTASGPDRRTVAVIDHAPAGTSTLVALATGPCGSGPSCATGGLVWSIQLRVD